MVQVVSRGGNYLLNMGPHGDGSIPDTTIAIFKEAGAWVKRHAESIYGTTANPFGETDWGYCTVKENKLFLFMTSWKEGKEIRLHGLQNEIRSASLLGNSPMEFPVNNNGEVKSIILTAGVPADPLPVIVVEIEGVPEVDPPMVVQAENGEMAFDYMTAVTEGNTMTRFNRKGGFHISK